MRVASAKGYKLCKIASGTPLFGRSPRVEVWIAENPVSVPERTSDALFRSSSQDIGDDGAVDQGGLDVSVAIS